MARPPRFNISAVRDLLEQLRYAPPETRRREMESAERFLREIDPEQNYPEDFLIFRVTGYRPNIDEPGLLIGKALWRDLAVFIERLSDSLALTVDDYAPRQAITQEEAAEQLGVSVSTLNRYRKMGLVAHQIVWPNDRKRLGFFADAVDFFAQSNPKLVKRARAFSHLDDEQKEEIFRRARRYRESLGYSLNETATRLAIRFDRTTEAMRQLLKRHDERDPSHAIFHNRGPLTDRDRQIMLRAHRRGVPTRFLVERFRRSRPAIYRAIHQERANRIRALDLRPILLPTFALEGAEEILLTSPVIRTGFNPDLEFGGPADEWVRSVETKEGELTEDAETALCGAMNFLLYDVLQKREQIDRHHPSAHEIDILETRLRWAARLKARLIASQQHDMLAVLEIHLGHRLLEASGSTIRRLHDLALSTARDSIDHFDPTRGQRLSVLVRYNLRRGLARVVEEGDQAARARPSARAKAGVHRIVLAGSRFRLHPWQTAIELSDAMAQRIRSGVLPEADSDLMSDRFGLGFDRPLTAIEAAEQRDLPAEQVLAMEQRILRRLFQIGSEQASRQAGR